MSIRCMGGSYYLFNAFIACTFLTEWTSLWGDWTKENCQTILKTKREREKQTSLPLTSPQNLLLADTLSHALWSFLVRNNNIQFCYSKLVYNYSKEIFHRNIFWACLEKWKYSLKFWKIKLVIFYLYQISH